MAGMTSFMGCVGAHAHETLLRDIEDAVKENSTTRLEPLLTQGSVSGEMLDQKNLLHQAAWFGFPRCVRMLLAHGADPEVPHRKNGCTPLHLAHFCTIDDTHPGGTIEALRNAGACVNNRGGVKCGKRAIDHAIQHQRLDSVQVLLRAGSQVAMQSILIAIDVANPQVVELLMLAGGDCGCAHDSTWFWGQPLHRVLCARLKGPRECYKRMFRLLTQGTVCLPVARAQKPCRGPSNQHLAIESELRALAKDHADLARYLYAFLLRNAFCPTYAIRTFVSSAFPVEWADEYLESAPPLQDLAVRVLRSHLYQSGNILHGAIRLRMPSRIVNTILIINPF